MVYVQFAKWYVGQRMSSDSYLNMQKLQIFSPEHFIVTLYYIRELSSGAGTALLGMLPLINPKELNRLILARRNWPVDCLYQACDQLFENLLVYLDVDDLTTGWGTNERDSMSGFLIGHLTDQNTMPRLLKSLHVKDKDIIMGINYFNRLYDDKTKDFRQRVDRVLTCLRTKCRAENFYKNINDRRQFLEFLVQFELHQFLSLFLKEDFQIILISERKKIYRKGWRRCAVCSRLLCR